MEIKGKVHCLFEQSGTFKNEFKKIGYTAEDYDIQNNYGETDHVIDLFNEIETAYAGIQNRTEQNRTEQNRTEQNRTEVKTVFNTMSSDDLILAFYPCIHFCDAKTLIFKGLHIGQRGKPLYDIMIKNIDMSKEREYFYELLLKLVAVCSYLGLRLVIENPYNSSGMTYLENNFIKPAIVDNNRRLRGDYFLKPTAYWFINCEPTNGFTLQNDKEPKAIMDMKSSAKAGICSEERSLISPDYARNWIYDFILGKVQSNIDKQLQFDF